MKKIIVLFISILLVMPVSAQVMGNSQYNNRSAYQQPDNSLVSSTSIVKNNEILIQTDGLMNIVADSYVAVFNLVQVGESAEETDRLMDERINNFKRRLEENEVDNRLVKVDLISFVPRYDIQSESKLFSKSYNEIPSGYELQKNISVGYKQSDKIDEIMSAALRSEIYDIVKIDYFINDMNSLRDSLRNVCLADVKNKIRAYEQIGIKLDTLDKNISDNFVTIYPQARYNSYQAFSLPSLSAAKKKQTVNEVPKVLSRFYSPQDYARYDIVVNPIITEPLVQLSYSVVVKFIGKEEKVLNILTPIGEITQFYQK